MILHDSGLGVIKGYLRPDGSYWIDEFILKPEHRGQGKAKLLASCLPVKCESLAIPLVRKGHTLSSSQLIAFYLSVGFTLCPDQFGNPIMRNY